MLNPCFTPFTQAMGVFIKYLLGKSITAKIEAVFGHWVNKVLAFFQRDKKEDWKENWSENYEQYRSK